MKKIIIIITGLMLIIVLSAGCAQNNETSTNLKYSIKADPVIYKADISDENRQIIPERKLEDDDLKEFYEFTQKFFAVWNAHIEDVAPFLEEFSSDSASFEEKIINSQILFEKYEKFYESLKIIKFPPEAGKAHEYVLNAISQRLLYMKKFQTGSSIDELAEIENEAYVYENLFWDEIDKAIEYYLDYINKETL